MKLRTLAVLLSLVLLSAAASARLPASVPKPRLTHVALIQAPTPDEPEARDASLTPEERKAHRRRRHWLYAGGALLTLAVVAFVYRRRTNPGE